MCTKAICGARRLSAGSAPPSGPCWRYGRARAGGKCAIRLLALALLLGACAVSGHEGPWVAGVALRGAKSLKASALLAGLQLRPRPWYGFLSGTKRMMFSEEALDRDLARIRSYYAARGFFSAEVKAETLRRADGGVVLTYLVAEGRPTLISRIEWRGLASLAPALRRRLLAEAPLKKGQRYDHGTFRQNQSWTGDQLKAAGYAYARPQGKVRVDRRGASAFADLDAKPGPLVRLARPSFSGAAGLPLQKLHRLIPWTAGTSYSPALIDEARERLFALRLFSSVTLELPPQPTPEGTIKIVLSPAKWRELRFGLGVGVDQQRQQVRLSARWLRRNLFGTLATLSVELRPAYVLMPALWDVERHGPAVDLDVALTQPDIFETGLTAFAKAGYELAVNPGYRYQGPRGELGLSRAFWRDRLRISGSYSWQFLDFFDFDKATLDTKDTPLGLGFVESYRLGWLSQQFELDLRDNAMSPRSGLYGALRLEQGLNELGGEFRYLKLSPELRAYLPLGTKRLVLAGRSLFSYLWPAEGQDSPVTRRVFWGGPNSHRGFGFRRLSPQVWDGSGRWIPLGGNVGVLFSGELRLRIVRLLGFWLDSVAFLDAGDSVVRPEELDFSNLHLAAGASLVYQTPIGAVRIVLGVRLNRLECVRPPGASEPAACTPGVRANPDPGERFAFHLTLGEAF